MTHPPLTDAQVAELQKDVDDWYEHVSCPFEISEETIRGLLALCDQLREENANLQELDEYAQAEEAAP